MITQYHTPEEPDLHTTEEDHHNIREYEIDRNDIEQTPTYGIEDHDRIPGRIHPDYNGFNENEITTKWYYPKSTDNRVVPPESEFFATIVGMWNFILKYFFLYLSRFLYVLLLKFFYLQA